MSLQATIHSNLVSAMKSGDSETRDVLRFLESAIKKMAIDSKKTELADEDVQKVITSQIKSRKDSVQQFRSGGREDLAQPEEKAIGILEAYLPKQMDDDELKTLVKSALEEAQITEAKDVGRAMGAVMPKVQGKADGNRVREIVQELLA